MVQKPRSSLLITYSTWNALFGREILSRLSGGRASLWILLDPIIHMLFLLAMFNFIRMKSVGGIDINVWLMVGFLSYDMFRDTSNQAMNAANANRALFTYRQVKPVDTILIRASVEAFLTLLIAIILFSGASLTGINVLPVDPLAVFEAVLGLWLIGLGYALIVSVLKEIIPGFGKILSIVTMPLYLCSGVMFPITSIAPPYRDWLLVNPLLHGVEAARLGFAPYYHAIPELDIAYIYKFALVSLFLGLALQTHYSNRLMTK